MDTLISKLVTQPQKASTAQLAQIADHVAAAPFADDLIAVDEPLWGGFWQGDVIAPGYSLPAVELALLRAIRLDGHWPAGTTVTQFLADLRRAIRYPQAGMWTLTLAGEPCVVFVAPENPKSVTAVWYCASTGRVHAGYRAVPEMVHFIATTPHRPLRLAGPSDRPSTIETNPSRPSWLAQVADQAMLEASSIAARLDAEILRIRLKS